MTLPHRGCSTGILLFATMAFAGPVSAQTLSAALEEGFHSHPALQARQAEVAIRRAEVDEARSGRQPTLTLGATASDGDRTGSEASDEGFRSGLDLDLSLPLWSGGRVDAAVARAEAELRAGEERLRAAELRVFAAIVTAHADVVRDKDRLRVRRFAVDVVSRQLEETRARFETGLITRTDVAQAQARLERARAEQADAEAALARSRAIYAAETGLTPVDPEGDLKPDALPSDLDPALAIAVANSPLVGEALARVEAADAGVRGARSGLLPSTGLTSSAGVGDVDARGGRIGDGSSRLAITASATQALFTGGLNASRLREAQSLARARRHDVDVGRRQVEQTVSAAWARFVAARASRSSAAVRLRSAVVAAEGVREEARAGLRTSLDVLNQELELRDAEIAVADGLRDERAAGAELLAAMGHLSREALRLAVSDVGPGVAQ